MVAACAGLQASWSGSVALRSELGPHQLLVLVMIQVLEMKLNDEMMMMKI